MIISLSGKVTHFQDAWIVLDIAGVGYQVFVPKYISVTPDNLLTLFISEQIREDSHTLYGFATLAERAFFEILLSVSGVGPKSALAIMSLGSIERVERAIQESDPTLFEAIPGIGKKVAAKIVVELKGKLGGVGSFLPSDHGMHTELVSTLESLGYKRSEILPLLRQIPAEITTLQQQIRWMLQQLVHG